MRDLHVVYLYHSTTPDKDQVYNLLNHHTRIFSKYNPSLDYTVLCDDGKYEGDGFVTYDDSSRPYSSYGRAWKTCDLIFLKHVASEQAVKAKHYLYVEYDCYINTNISNLIDRYKGYDVSYSFHHDFGDNKEFYWYKEHEDVIKKYNIPPEHLCCMSPFNFTLWKREFLLECVNEYINHTDMYQTLVSDVRLGLMCNRLKANKKLFIRPDDRVFNYAMKRHQDEARIALRYYTNGVFHAIKELSNIGS